MVLGSELFKEMEQQVAKIKMKLKVAYDRKNSYVDKGIIPRGFRDWEHLFPESKPNNFFLKLGSCTVLETKKIVDLFKS